MNVIVTGAGGFLGQNLIRSLAAEENFIYAVVRHKTEAFRALKNVRVIELKNGYEGVASQIDKDVDLFYHFAWSGTSGPVRNDETVQIENIKNSCEAIRFAIGIKCRKFVFFGSIMEFDVFNHHPLAISSANTTMYSLTKYTAHYLTEIIAESAEMEYVSATISNIYGPGEISKRFVYSMLTRMLDGDQIQLSSCQQPYDFIYIDDAVEQIKAIGRHGRDRCNYYIGNREQKQLKYYVELMNKIVNKNAVLSFSADTSHVVSDYYEKFSTGQTEDEFCLTPKISFEEGIKRTLEWIIENRETK